MWIAEVKWKLENKDEIEFFGPFEFYDEGIKVWSAEFAASHDDQFEYIDYHFLNTP